MNEEQTNERYSRQRDIVPAERIAECKASVIGVGAIGRQVAVQLTAMGIARLQLMDCDIVEESNLASQGHLEEDLDEPKVEATAALCRRINRHLEVHTVPDRFRRSMEMGNIVFCCVDHIDVRRLIWESAKGRVNYHCDGRISPEVLRVLTACDFESRKHYPTTLFSTDEAFVGPCTAKTTTYCANIAAGLMLAQFTEYLRGIPIQPDIQVNLLASELTVVPSC